MIVLPEFTTIAFRLHKAVGHWEQDFSEKPAGDPTSRYRLQIDLTPHVLIVTFSVCPWTEIKREEYECLDRSGKGLSLKMLMDFIRLKIRLRSLKKTANFLNKSNSLS